MSGSAIACSSQRQALRKPAFPVPQCTSALEKRSRRIALARAVAVLGTGFWAAVRTQVNICLDSAAALPIGRIAMLKSTLLVDGFSVREIRRRCDVVGCDPRSYRKELERPGSVLGAAGVAIRADIAVQRAERDAAAPPKRGRKRAAI